MGPRYLKLEIGNLERNIRVGGQKHRLYHRQMIREQYNTVNHPLYGQQSVHVHCGPLDQG